MDNNLVGALPLYNQKKEQVGVLYYTVVVAEGNFVTIKYDIYNMDSTIYESCNSTELLPRNVANALIRITGYGD